MSRGTQLLELQEVENALRDQIDAYKKVQRDLNEGSPVRQARDAYEAAQAAEKEARARQAEVNHEWQKVIQKADEEEKRLYSGVVKNPKELENLQLEVEFLKRRRADLEEQALAIIEEVDVLTRRSAEAKATYEAVEKEMRQRQGDLEEKENRLKRAIGQGRRQREKMMQLIDAADLEQYRYVQRLKNDTFAVAVLHDGVCNACHIEVSAAKRDVVERSDTNTLVTCGNCGRILIAG